MSRAPKIMPAPVTVDIHGVSHDGRGIAAISGKTTFVHGALKNETVRIQIQKQHRRYNEAMTLEVLTPSPDRTAPRCPHFGVCGGCSMQHMTSEAQIKLKQQMLLEQLQHFGKVTPATILPPLLNAEPWGYRRKARLGVRYVKKKERVLVGFRERLSNYLADLTTCPVLHPAIGTRLTELSALIASLSQFEHIPQIEVAITDEASALIFRHLTNLPPEDIAKLQAFGERYQFHIYLHPNSPAAVHKIYPQDGSTYLNYQIAEHDLTLQFHPQDFTQVNSAMNARMIHHALTLLAPNANDDILDLFCGMGNFTLPLARLAKTVTGVEGATEMVERATANAQLNQLTNTQFFAANLMAPPLTAAFMQHQYDKILLDPPRSGAQEIIAHFATFNAPRVVYVSCNPATLARDAALLVHEHGYQLKAVGLMDMFPHTSHVEAIALFENK